MKPSYSTVLSVSIIIALSVHLPVAAQQKAKGKEEGTRGKEVIHGKTNMKALPPLDTLAIERIMGVNSPKRPEYYGRWL
jgi:hypothetical protein